MILLNSIKNREFVIKEIVNDEELVLVPNAANPTDVEKINCNFKIMPKIDQSSLFESVYDHLHQGKCIGIFPEVFFFSIDLSQFLKKYEIKLF